MLALALGLRLFCSIKCSSLYISILLRCFRHEPKLLGLSKRREPISSKVIHITSIRKWWASVNFKTSFERIFTRQWKLRGFPNCLPPKMRFNFFFFYPLLCLVRKGYQFNLLREHIRLVISSFITNITYIAYIAYIEYMQFWITRLQGIRLLHDKRSGRDHLRVPPSCWRDLRELSRCLHLHKESGPVLFFLSWQVYFFRIIYKKSTINLFTVWH